MTARLIDGTAVARRVREDVARGVEKLVAAGGVAPGLATSIQQASSSGNLVTIIIENVLGTAVHHVATFANPNSTYTVVSNGTELLVKGTIIGHGVDDDGNVTAYLIESGGTVTFPTTIAGVPAIIHVDSKHQDAIARHLSAELARK